MVPKYKDLGVVRRLALKLITKVQKCLLKSDKIIATDLYYFLAEKHFSIYFSGQYTLKKAILEDTDLGIFATNRHARLVVKALYSTADEYIKNKVVAASRGSFRKNVILAANPEV